MIFEQYEDGVLISSVDLTALAAGLGTLSGQDANSVSISGGSITGITDLAVADGGTGASNASDARINLGVVIGSNVQAYSAQLDSAAAVGNGMTAHTAANTFTPRTITGTANQVSVSNGDGVAGNPTISLPSTINISTAVQINSRPVSDVLIQTITASTTATIDFTDLPAGFSTFEVRADGIRPVNDGDDLRFRTSPNTGGSPTFDTGAADYGYASHLVNDAAATAADGAASANHIGIVAGWGNAANETGSLILTISNPLASQYCHVSWRSTSTNGSAVLRHNAGGGRRKSAAAVNAIRLYFSSGSVLAGVFKLYGKV